jgi:exopolysaccharide production protein ExoQ
LAMLVGLLVISNSMTSLGCFALASGLMIAVNSPLIARKRALIHLMVVAIVSAVFLTLFVDVGGALLLQIGRNPTLTGRTELWPVVLALEENPLFGTGFESFWLGPRLEKIWGVHWWRPNQAHNGYLEIYLTLGWIGIGLLALVAINGYRNILQMLRSDPVGAKLRLAYFVVAIAYNLTESAFRTLHPVWQAFLLAVIVLPRSSVKRAVKRQERENAVDRKPKPAEAFAGPYGTRRA